MRSLAWAVACFAGLFAGGAWGVHLLLASHGWLAWTAEVLGSIGVALLAFWLFLPVAAGIGMLFCDRIASAVERRFYPWLPRAESASILEQARDSVSVAVNVFALSIAALILAFIVPGLGLVLGWMIAAYAIGRGLFVAVAMRRMSRSSAEFDLFPKSRHRFGTRRHLSPGRLYPTVKSIDPSRRHRSHGSYP